MMLILEANLFPEFDGNELDSAHLDFVDLRGKGELANTHKPTDSEIYH